MPFNRLSLGIYNQIYRCSLKGFSFNKAAIYPHYYKKTTDIAVELVSLNCILPRQLGVTKLNSFNIWVRQGDRSDERFLRSFVVPYT